jgi:hypothetical protein
MQWCLQQLALDLATGRDRQPAEDDEVVGVGHPALVAMLAGAQRAGALEVAIGRALDQPVEGEQAA